MRQTASGRRLRRDRGVLTFLCSVSAAVLTEVAFAGAECEKAPVGEASKAASRPRKFRRVWTFTQLRDEEFARKIAALNVQNVGGVKTPEKLAIAKKYGLIPYISGWASGIHRQEMSPRENDVFRRLDGEPQPPGLKGEALRHWKADHKAMRNERLRAMGYAWGGEPQPGRENDDVLLHKQQCFVGPAARSNSVAKILERLDHNPDAGMVLFDFVGYQNYRRCHHPDCERLYREFLKEHNLKDSPEGEKEFFLSELVAVNNAMHDAIKARNPKIVTGTHIYPVYLPEPLYGYRLKFDVIAETCAWYLKWPEEKIRAYTADCLSNRPADYPRSRRLPFIAVTRNNWCKNKTAAEVERELNDILDAGADEIVAFEMTAIVDDPELYEVFLKYCGAN